MNLGYVDVLIDGQAGSCGKGKFAGYIDDAFYSHNMGIDTGMRYFKES